MIREEAIKIWETVPYERVHGYTQKNGCYCAMGILLKEAGWIPMGESPSHWTTKTSMHRYRFHSERECAAALALDLPFLAQSVRFSDGVGLDGPKLAEKMKEWFQL